VNFLPLPETSINPDEFFSGGEVCPFSLERILPGGGDRKSSTHHDELKIPLSHNWLDKILLIYSDEG